jgi:DegV family protein with EDD domain
MSAEHAAELGVTVVPLAVSFGNQSYRAGVEMTTAEFWARMTAPDAPFPTTAASAPGDFRDAYQAAFDAGAGAVVSIHVAGTLSGTIKAAEVARGMLPEREIHIVDSMGASMCEGILAELGVEMAHMGVSAAEIARVLTERRDDVDMFVALDTLEYLKRGGRISGASAAIGTLLSVKPIVRVKDGKVETVDKPRTKGKARERLIELVTTRPIERLCVLHTMTPDVEAFRDELVARLPGGIEPSRVTIDLVGPSIGPHLGPGCVGAIVLYRPE